MRGSFSLIEMMEAAEEVETWTRTGLGWLGWLVMVAGKGYFVQGLKGQCGFLAAWVRWCAQHG